jgi:hypothetical protein
LNAKGSDVEDFTLSPSLFKNRRNDFVCVIRNIFFWFWAHQSTSCGNIPARELVYAGRVFESYSNVRYGDAIYKGKTLVFPAPEFICLYNGSEPMPDYSEVRLSDAFAKTGIAEIDGNPSLELVVKIYNINEGRNADVLDRSPTLKGYSVFVSKTHEYRKTMPLNEAIRMSMLHCIQNGHLADYFSKHGTEACNMFLDELDSVEKERVIEELGKALEEKDKALEEHSKTIEEKDKALEEHSKALEEHSKTIEEMSRIIEDLKKRLEEEKTSA